jgi:hypothetical protein
MRHLKISYSDILSMPVYERRFFLTTFINETEKRNEQMEAEQSTTSSGNGKRTTKVSGSQLKERMKNGEIPDQ